MLFTIDIGNTNIVFGIYENDRLMRKFRMITDAKKSANDYAIDIVENFLTEKIDCLQISGCIVSSVVPSLDEVIKNAIAKFYHQKIYFINSCKLDIDIKIKNKKEVGDDRLVNSIKAFDEFKTDLIIVDFGTATTFDCVSKNKEYLGGVISPGINLSLKALHDMTAKLPQIQIKKQKNVIGKSTIEAMNSGVYFGYLSLVEGIVSKIENELGYKCERIITGGLCEIFKSELKNYHYRPNLTLDGLNLIYDINKTKHNL